MGLKTCEFEHSTKFARVIINGALASVLAFLTFVICMPQLAFADDTYQTIDGTMTITMFDGGISGGAGTITTTTTTTSSTATGDALMWLVLGVAVLIVGAVYIFIKSRSLATNNAGESASIGAHASAGTDVDASSKKKTIIVAVVTALIACMCFGMYANKGVAFAKDTFSNIFGSSAVVVDEDGNVLSNAITVVNGEDEAIIIKSIEAPADLSGWNADIANKTIESGEVAEGEWYASTIPATLLEQLKNNNGYAELTFTMNVEDAKTPLDFDEFLIGEGAKDYTYTGQQITPSVTSLVYGDEDFEVTYGENINAGVGTVTIKGIGDYKGEKSYTFTIKPASIESKSVTISEEGTTYTGDQLKPKVTIDGLTEGTDFTVSYGENKTAGTGAGMVTVIGKDNYTSSQTKTFDIARATPECPAPTGITAEVEQTLAEVSIPAQVAPQVPGTFVWEGDTLEKFDTVGETTRTAKFIPEDTVNYKEVSGISITITVTEKKVAFAVYSDEGEGVNSLTFYKDFENNVPAKDDTYNNKHVTDIYTDVESTTYTRGHLPGWVNDHKASITKVEVANKISPKESTAFWFYWCNALTSVDSLSNLDISEVTDMTSMFYGCGKLTSLSGVADWNTSKVENMSNLFRGCSSLATIDDVSNWDTSNVTKMGWLFGNCYALIGSSDSTSFDLSKWDTSKVTSMEGMFNTCRTLETVGDISQWETGSVTNMGKMFYRCSVLEANCSEWNVTKVKDHSFFNNDAKKVQSPF